MYAHMKLHEDAHKKFITAASEITTAIAITSTTTTDYNYWQHSK